MQDEFLLVIEIVSLDMLLKLSGTISSAINLDWLDLAYRAIVRKRKNISMVAGKF